MTEKGRSVLARAARVLLACGVLSLGASGLWAQGTAGKVQGTVLDPTGQPIANAQVFVLGTSFAALTNQDGFYFINRVPSGVYSMRAQFIGYQPAQIENVRVLADQTLTVDFRLSGAVALEAITITAAEAPIVPRDQVASKFIVTGETIDALPAGEALDVVRLSPGVVSARGGQITIRGSRAREAVIFIDGAPVRRLILGDTPASLSTNMLAEASVTTGAMEAQFGDAQAGVISLVSRTGGPTFVGTFAYETDDVWGKSLAQGFNRFEAAVSGPVIGNLTFSVGGTLQGTRAAAIHKGDDKLPIYTFGGIDTVLTVLASGSSTDSTEVFLPRFIQYGGECEAADNFGFECQGRRAPYDWTTDARLNAKLNFSYGSGSRISLSGLTNLFQQSFPTNLGIESASGRRFVSDVVVLNWVQQIFRGSTSELSVDATLSYQRDRDLIAPLDRATDLDLRDPMMGMVLSPLDFVIDWDNFSPDTTQYARGFTISSLATDEDWDRLIENVRYNRGTLRAYRNRVEVFGSGVARANAYGTAKRGGSINTGLQGGVGYNYERRYVGRFNVDWQADRYNRFKFGADGTTGRAARWNSSLTTEGFGENFVGEPVKWGAYVQDRLDLGDVVIELGLRYDQYSAGGVFPLIPGLLFQHPVFDQDATIEQMTCPEANVEDCDSDVWVFGEAKQHKALSPRVRVSFPITDRTGFRLSYAHQVQPPRFFDIYEGTNNDLFTTNENERFGGDAGFGKTIMFEFGVRHAFSPDLVLDVSAYNKDKVSDHTYRLVPYFFPNLGRVTNVNVLTNADFGNVRGIDLGLLYRYSNIFSGNVSYTFQNARSTGSDPFDYITGLSRQAGGVALERPEPPQLAIRTEDDRRHNIQGTFALTFPSDFAEGSAIGAVLQNLGAFGTFYLRSGLPFTRFVNNANGTRSGGGCGLVCAFEEPLQASETPWTKILDLRLTKGFRLGPIDWTAYADIRNLFDFTNVNTVFIETGDVVNEKFFQNQYLVPELLQNEQDARASGAWTQTAEGVGAIDLRNLGRTCPGWRGGGGAAACVMLQRAEARFGDGDGLYDVNEQTAAVEALYEIEQGPHRSWGAARRIRVGLQLTF